MPAVLTGDIVNSTLLPPQREKKLLNILDTIMKGHRHEFFRGDSFQTYLHDAGEALKTALLCRTAAIALDPNADKVLTDVRVSIGIGEVVSPIGSLATAKGEAFLISGRALDALQKTEGRLIIVTENKITALAFEVRDDTKAGGSCTGTAERQQPAAGGGKFKAVQKHHQPTRNRRPMGGNQ